MFEQCFCAWGTLPGEIQSVGRAELYAAIRLLETTAGQLVLWTDYKSLVDGFARGRRYTLGCSRMADLWARLWEAVDARPGGAEHVQIKKIKAHQSLASVRAGAADCSMQQWLGNRQADILARRGADEHKLPDEVVSRVELHTRMATLFLRRMIIVMQHVLEKRPEAVSRPRKGAEKPSWEAKRRRLTTALSTSGHALSRRTLASGRSMWFCARCFACRPVGPGLLCWLRNRPCVPAADGMEVAACPRAHFSHHLEFWGEVVICRECGCYSGPGTRIQDLRWPCPGRPSATKWGQKRARCNWQRCQQGLHPASGLAMQRLQEEEVLAFGFGAVGRSLWAVGEPTC